MEKASLLLIAHGSRRRESNEEIRTLASELAQRVGQRYVHVDCAFLELAEPSIPQAIDNAVRDGGGTVIILPYFLAAGTHVAHDIPAIIAAKQRQYPDVQIVLKPYIGSMPAIVELLLEAV